MKQLVTRCGKVNKYFKKLFDRLKRNMLTCVSRLPLLASALMMRDS
ncbi:hypothetical protein VP468E531_P0078 [Vibrio phage 468E53-1]|nr:hypothetical protein VP468E531_P0078 [Vibrio phage 468E53-1]